MDRPYLRVMPRRRRGHPAGDLPAVTYRRDFSTQTILDMARLCEAEYCLFYHKSLPLELGFHALDRLLRVADDTRADLLYADHYAIQDGTRNPIRS